MDSIGNRRVAELKIEAVSVMVVDDMAPFPIGDAQQLGEEVRVIVGGLGSQQGGGEPRQRIPLFAEVHAADRTLDQCEAHPLVDILHMEGSMLEKDDLRPARRSAINEPKKIQRRCNRDGAKCLLAGTFDRAFREYGKIARPFLVER
ncbi:hypothetical protein [Bradyrhizobium sp. SZCCHNS2005]|uniref:hypothetical protein n=1 Tax=Bradyrhizobium sp. SZCCHNS2005 TaxID=3057303 RepID=UPI0028E5F957|nr:hypothetical protein [Bradyrhizobium sp. SZCCHNS2005]